MGKPAAASEPTRATHLSRAVYQYATFDSYEEGGVFFRLRERRGIVLNVRLVPEPQKSRDDALVDLFIPVLNDRLGTSFALRERPDEIVRDRPQIEVVAVDSSGDVLRVEHTRLEPFLGEGADWGRLRDITDATEGDASIRRIGRAVDVEFAVGAFDVVEKWGRDKPRIYHGRRGLAAQQRSRSAGGTQRACAEPARTHRHQH